MWAMKSLLADRQKKRLLKERGKPVTKTSHSPGSQNPESTLFSHFLEFPYRRYPLPDGSDHVGPYVSTSLFKGDLASPYKLALLDTGADCSLMPCRAAEQIGINPRSGRETPLTGFASVPDEAGQNLVGWVHDEIGIAIRGPELGPSAGIAVAIVAPVVFCEDMELSGVLGRSFMRAFRASFDEADARFFLGIRRDADLVQVETVPKYVQTHTVRLSP